jgi:hypothetical protein
VSRTFPSPRSCQLLDAGQADLDDVGSEGADVADDVDVAGADVGLAGFDAGDGIVDVDEALLQFGGVPALVGYLEQDGLVVAAFLEELRLLAFELLARLLFLARDHTYVAQSSSKLLPRRSRRARSPATP